MILSDCELNFYGYLTNTGIKVILAVKDNKSSVDNTDKVQDMFRSMHRYMMQYLANPFLEEDTEDEFIKFLQSRVDAKVAKMQ